MHGRAEHERQHGLLPLSQLVQSTLQEHQRWQWNQQLEPLPQLLISQLLLFHVGLNEQLKRNQPPQSSHMLQVSS